MLSPQKLRYLVVGGTNTVIGYVIGVGIYKLFFDHLNIFLIGLISNILCISISFFTYKVFVFKTKGRWIIEYCKAYFVYGGVAIVGILVLWIFVDIIKMDIWITQVLVITSAVLVSYIGHSRFTFHRNNK